MKIIKNIKKNSLLLLLITIIVLYFVLKDDLNETLHLLSNLNIIYIIITILLVFISISLKGYINYLIVNDKKKVSLKESIKHNFITQFFNGITPFASGGQPMEVYMLTEHDITLTKATNYTIESFIFYQIALVICGILAVTYNFIFHIFPKVSLLKHLVLLGFTINILVVILLHMISYSEKTTKKISNITKKIVKKFRINVKEDEIDKKFSDYYNGFQELRKNKTLAIRGIFLNIISLICIYISPLFILYAMKDYTSLNIVNTLTTSAYVYVIGSFVPIPGASGGIEYGFTQFYGNFIDISKISAVLLIWRFVTYYLGVIFGAILFNLEKRVVE
jgi:hypothetical protein